MEEGKMVMVLEGNNLKIYGKFERVAKKAVIPLPGEMYHINK